MKQLLTFFALLAALTIQAQLPSYVPTDGLVGYWGFNGNANDESGNGNDGTVNGATLTEDRFGSENSAFFFDGVNDNILLPNLGFSDAFTISAFINAKENSFLKSLIGSSSLFFFLFFILFFYLPLYWEPVTIPTWNVNRIATVHLMKTSYHVF